MKKRRIFALALVVLLTAAMLAGCASGNKPAEQAVQSDRISISIYMWDRSMFKQLSPWLEQKFPNIDFTFVQSYNTME